MPRIRFTRDLRPEDPRWELVEGRDRLGRAFFSVRPRVGARFGTLLVLDGGVGVVSRTQVRCECGRVSSRPTATLRRGGAPCRCRRRVSPYEGVIADQAVRLLWLHRYTGIISRCYDTGHRAYPNYGGRGIRIYRGWRRDRAAFLRYAVTLVGWDNLALDLDRIDNDRGYAPGNLRLCSRSENSRNRRNAVRVEWAGREWAFADFHACWCPRWSANTIRYHQARGRTVGWIVDRYRATVGL
jgi:hypothetical protein